jgi:aspartate/methionine/tyrosine aminotransferase
VNSVSEVLVGSQAPAADRPAGIRRTVAELPASKIGEVAALALGDPSVIPLWFGEGDLVTPAFIGEAATKALAEGHTFYTFKRGIPPLRQTIAEYLSALHQVPIAAERVMVTSSGMSAIMLVCQTLVDPGDNVVIVAPVWPNINAAVEMLGGEARNVSLVATEDGGWRLDLDRLFAACDARTRAIFVNSPSNPTGWMMAREEAIAILDFVRRRGLWLLGDDVYERIVYGNSASASFLSICEPDDRVISLNSFSKSWAMTGWRLGWMVAPVALNPIMDKLIEINTSGAPTFLQHAAIAAIGDGEDFIRSFVQRCQEGREVVFQGLARLPRVRIARPQGAFYAFFAVDGVADSLAFAKKVLAEAKVGLAPGAAFGAAGEGYLRLCFASSRGRLEEAVDRLTPLLS